MNTNHGILRGARPRLCALSLLLLTGLTATASARTLRVGPDRNYKQIRDAARVAGDGDVILIDAGVYRADVTEWNKDNLVIWAPDGRAHLRAEGASEDGKGTWVIEGRNFTAENIEFSGARVRDRNGAGVRIHAKGNVTLRNCYFHDNENGVLGEADELVIDGCVFDRNGAGDGQSHNIYVWGQSVTIRNSYIHRAVIGHNVKTRGKTNFILYNRIMDEANGTASYSIDVPDCGRTYIIGNVIEQGPRSENYDVVSYGAESDKNVSQELYVINNTFVNNGRPDGAFLRCRRGTEAQVTNNIFYGPGMTWSGGRVSQSHNTIAPSLENGPRFANPSSYNYHLTSASPRVIIDKGISPGVSSTGYDLTPKHEYVYDARSRPRPVVGALDIGAFEFTGAGISAGSKRGATKSQTLQRSRTVQTSAKVTKAKKKKARTASVR